MPIVWSAAYNQRLSQARAETVKAYLQQQGVRLPIATEGRGMRKPLVACAGVQGKVALVTCLEQPNRRVEIMVHAERVR